MKHPCAAGMTKIVSEYDLGTSERARKETWSASPKVLKWMGPGAARIIRLVDLTVAYDERIGTVGGPIDALELFPNGGLRWIQRKQNCPENRD